MRTLKYVPGHANTLMAGDSHLTAVDGKDIDREDDQVRVRSVGGLCLVSAVHALTNHQMVHKRFRCVERVLGTN